MSDYDIDDEQAKDELLLITKLVTKFLPSSFDRESLVQDIWLEVHKRQVPITSFMVRGRAIDLMRRRGRQRQRLREYRPPPHSHPDTSSVVEALGQSSLSPLETRVIYQYFYRGDTQQEAAKTLGISTGAMSYTLRGALQKVKAVYFQ